MASATVLDGVLTILDVNSGDSYGVQFCNNVENYDARVFHITGTLIDDYAKFRSGQTEIYLLKDGFDIIATITHDSNTVGEIIIPGSDFEIELFDYIYAGRLVAFMNGEEWGDYCCTGGTSGDIAISGKEYTLTVLNVEKLTLTSCDRVALGSGPQLDVEDDIIDWSSPYTFFFVGERSFPIIVSPGSWESGNVLELSLQNIPSTGTHCRRVVIGVEVNGDINQLYSDIAVALIPESTEVSNPVAYLDYPTESNYPEYTDGDYVYYGIDLTAVDGTITDVLISVLE